MALNAGAALNVGLEASGLNAAASAGDAIGSGEASGLAAAALIFVPGSATGRGLRGATSGLASLFKRGGGLADETIIGIRSRLTEAGFSQSLAQSGKGYLFTNEVGEQVRIMSGDNGWVLRIRNQFGNYLDELGNPGGRAATHLPIGSR